MRKLVLISTVFVVGCCVAGCALEEAIGAALVSELFAIVRDILENAGPIV